MMRAPFFRLSPLLLLAAALVALAVFFAPGAPSGAQPVAAQEESVFKYNATLTVKRVLGNRLGCDNSANSANQRCSRAATLTEDTFTLGGTDFTITGIQLFTSGSGEGSLRIELDGPIPSNADQRTTLHVNKETTVNGVKTFERKSFSFTDAFDLNQDGVDYIGWTNAGLSWQRGDTVHLSIIRFAPLSFNGATVDDMTFTAGHEISLLGLSEEERDALALPEATGGGFTRTYSARFLPPGLYMGQDRIIRGTPESSTERKLATYTATVDSGASEFLVFYVTVKPKVVFDADERQAFKDTIFEYTVGQAEQINATLPAASGGHGALTYGLTYRVKEQRMVDGRTITGGVVKTIDDDAPGFSFDASTRVLSSDIGATAPSASAFYSVDYWAEDENGARAVVSNSISVKEAPTLPAIADQEFTAGQNVSITLPKAEGGSIVGIGIRYRLEPEVAGLVFNGRQNIRSLSGRPTVPGTTAMTYTATDRNGVSATRTFDVTVVNGPSAPASAPSSVQAAQASSAPDPNGSGAAAVWDTVSGATGYVVQVIADGGSYPDLKVNSAPADVNLNLPDPARGLVWIDAISTGDYKVRVAARNDDGVGPWSVEVSFTVSGPAPQPQQQSGGRRGPCDNCGTGGDVGAVTQGQSEYAELIARMYEWRNDPEWKDYKSHTDRWDRALLAFGETVADATLTAMSAAEAQALADQDWGERWVPVAAALRELPNRAPTVALALADKTGLEAGAAAEVSLSGVFSDADGDALTVTAASSDEAVATVSVSADYSTLTVTGASEGTATITVTAEDPEGEGASDAFDVSVIGKYAALIARMYQWRNDSQWVSYQDHTGRWDRALLAFGEAVSDATLTPMTAAEAQGFADRGSAWSRWVEVAAALREMEGGVQAQSQPEGQQQPAPLQTEPQVETAQAQQGTPNQPPTVSSAIADATIVNETGTKQISLSGVFSDGDNDALTVTAASSDEAVATVSLAADHSTLTVNGKTRGTATVTVTANDGNGGAVEDAFTVTVKAAPVLASALADVSGLVVGDTQDVSLAGVFSDADGDALTITAASGDEAIATVSVASGGSKLTLTGAAEGAATITVTAQDSDGNRVSGAFQVEVVQPQAPEEEQQPEQSQPAEQEPSGDSGGAQEAPASTPAAQAWASLAHLDLLVVWHYDADSEEWSFYSPMNPEEFNSLTEMVAGQTYQVCVTETVTATLNGRSRTLTYNQGNCWNTIVW